MQTAQLSLLPPPHRPLQLTRVTLPGCRYNGNVYHELADGTHNDPSAKYRFLYAGRGLVTKKEYRGGGRQDGCRGDRVVGGVFRLSRV